MQQRKLVVADSPEDLIVRAHAHILKKLEEHPDEFSLSLAGGSTPKGVYLKMSKSSLPWDRLQLIFGDERFVPHDHPDSNYKMVKGTLLLSAPPEREKEHVFPWPIQENAKVSAETYELLLRERFPTGVDLMMLGMGDDGHTASLFPETQALQEKTRWAVANRVEKLDSWRLTLTYPFLALSREIMFLVSGAGKAAALNDVLSNNQHPSGKVTCKGTTWFYVDQAAAADLPKSVIDELS